MKSAVLKDLKVSIVETKKPSLDSKGAIIKVLGCGLCGSDIIKIKHATKENESNIKLGHEVVGEIVEVDTNTSYKKGDIVALGHHYPCFNCDYCRREKFFDKIVNFAKNNEKIIEFCDQDSINKIADEKKLVLHPKYNYMDTWWRGGYY